MQKRTYVLICLFIVVFLNALMWFVSSAHADMPYPNVALQFNSTECTYENGVTARACSRPGTTYLSSDYTNYALHYELGHQVDWLWLNGTERAWLMHNWRIAKRSWNDSYASIAAGNEDGGEGIFPMVYAYCWFHKSDVGWAFQYQPNSGAAPGTNPIARPKQNDCAAIRSWFG